MIMVNYIYTVISFLIGFHVERVEVDQKLFTSRTDIDPKWEF